ncbi:uncharacterized protein LOC111242321 [Vigna radiata var. radiata]|uniref:Uncharacterized protein LOC111242321 n=1 Tax=Vigna radiata var. radiata TaxID=3916 RepID=A0A3Q0FED5_VIGRR|nr:uncharacterized protein LOC111242321 [Vigna radiata var. radiata]
MIEYNVHEEQLDDGIQHEGGESAKLDVDRIAVEVDGEEVEIDVGEGEGIELDEAINERIEVVDGEEEQVDVRESEGIEVDNHIEEVQVDVGESEGIQNEEGHDEEIVEVNTTVVNEWSSSDDDIGEVNIVDGEVHGVDALVDVNVQCDFSQRDSLGNMEVDCSVISESDLEQHHESDLEEHEISDTSLFNDEWEFEELTSPDISDVEEGYGNFDTFIMHKKMVDFKWEVGTFFG